MYGPDARAQHDKDNAIRPVGAPFISCYIGSDPNNGVHIGNTYLQKQDGVYDSRYIKSIEVTRRVPETASSIFDALLQYIRKINTPSDISPEDKARLGKDAEKASKKQKEKYEEAMKAAPKDLEQRLNGVVSRHIGGGVSATIQLSLIGDMDLMTWFFNYSVSQNMIPNLRLQYGLLTEKGEHIRVSPVYEGIIMSAQVSGFYDMTLGVQFLPNKAWGWSPEDFNKIFQDKDRKPDAAKKTNNSSPEHPYKEGQAVVSVNEKTRRYSSVVKRIADGLKWNVGLIEPTTLMPEEVLLTVDNFEDGPLVYIQKHFCGTLDQKDGNGKTIKAGAISENGHFSGYQAYFDMDEKKRFAFYYVPTQAVARKAIDNAKIYEYYVSATESDGSFQSEVKSFTLQPVNLQTTMFNVEKGDGKGQTDLPIVDNSRKEVGNTTYTEQTNVKSAGASSAQKAVKGSAQNPTFRNLSDDARYAIAAYEVNKSISVANTWSNNQLEADMTVVYDESLRLLQIIYVCVILPMNDSTTLQGNTITKKVIHPSSGLYRIIGIQDTIDGNRAESKLKLKRLVITQEELNQMTALTEANSQQVEKEKKAREERLKKAKEAKEEKKEE